MRAALVVNVEHSWLNSDGPVYGGTSPKLFLGDNLRLNSYDMRVMDEDKIPRFVIANRRNRRHEHDGVARLAASDVGGYRPDDYGTVRIRDCIGKHDLLVARWWNDLTEDAVVAGCWIFDTGHRFVR